jgi:hypothetical protein
MEPELRKLSPEERIKKLKELEEKKKKEIEEAAKEIEESRKEIASRQKWLEKVPIPEVGKEELSELSVEGKELLKRHKGIKEKEKETETKVVGEEPEAKRRKKEDLGEFLRGQEEQRRSSGAERAYLTAEQWQAEVYQRSQQPIAELYSGVREIRDAATERGYISREQEQEVRAIESALELRLKEKYGGSLSSEIVAKSSLIKQMGKELRDMYGR